MRKTVSEGKRPLLTMGLVTGLALVLGVGSAFALESSYVTASSVPMVVKPVPPRPVQPVQTVSTAAVYGCSDCGSAVYSEPVVVYQEAPVVVYQSAPVVVRERRVVRRAEPRVVYSSPVVSTPLCSNCR